RIVIADRKRSPGWMPSAQAATLGSVRSRRRSSERTLVSSRYIGAHRSGKIGRAKDAGVEAWRVELDILDARLVQQLANGRAVSRQAAIGVVTHEHIGRLA